MEMEILNLCAISEKIRNRHECLQWIQNLKLLPKEMYCKKHRRQMLFLKEKHFCGMFRCRDKNKSNAHEVSAAHNTWFENSRITPGAVMVLTYAFVFDFSYMQAIRESSLTDETISSETVADRYSFCREICGIALDKLYEEEGLIGGPGIIVEIDESKIGKRKYNRGRLKEGTWVFGMIERGGEKRYRLEVCPDNKRDKKTLMTLLEKHVAKGSEIHSDCWKAYNELEEEYGYTHKTVNHSKNFVDPESGAYTQNIEASWRHLKRSLCSGGHRNEYMFDYLNEFLWRRECRKSGKDPFNTFINDINYVYSLDKDEL